MSSASNVHRLMLPKRCFESTKAVHDRPLQGDDLQVEKRLYVGSFSVVARSLLKVTCTSGSHAGHVGCNPNGIAVHMDA